MSTTKKKTPSMALIIKFITSYLVNTCFYVQEKTEGRAKPTYWLIGRFFRGAISILINGPARFSY